MLRGDFGGTAGAGAFLSRQPDFTAVVIELLHRADFLVRDGVRRHDGFDVVAGGEVGFDAGAEGGGEGAGHGCLLVERKYVGCRILMLETVVSSAAAMDSDTRDGLGITV